jgi:hypothetical protein
LPGLTLNCNPPDLYLLVARLKGMGHCILLISLEEISCSLLTVIDCDKIREHKIDWIKI